IDSNAHSGILKMTMVDRPTMLYNDLTNRSYVPVIEGKSGSRSMRRVALVALAVAIVVFALPASAQQNIDFSKVEIKTIDLGHNTYRLEGQGGNITVAVGSDGIIMVDGQFAPLHDKIKAAIAAISPLPIKYLINTHFHGDHTGGNEAFQKD